MSLGSADHLWELSVSLSCKKQESSVPHGVKRKDTLLTGWESWEVDHFYLSPRGSCNPSYTAIEMGSWKYDSTRSVLDSSSLRL